MFKLITGEGTPKSIDEAIRNGLTDVKICPDVDEVLIMKAHIKEFMAQKFGLSKDPIVVWRMVFNEKATNTS